MSGQTAGEQAETAPRGTGRTAALARWKTEWERWRVSPAAADGLARWRSRHEGLAGFASVDDLVRGCGRDRSVPREVADARLATLVSEARDGDQAAARVVLERLMPALVRAATLRAMRSTQPFGPLLDDMVAAAWLRIVDYPLASRPIKIAGNIVADANYRVFGYVPLAARSTDLLPPDELPVGLAGLAGQPVEVGVDPGLRVLRLLTDAAQGGLPVADARLLAELVVCGRTPEQIAARDGVTSRAVRYRRQAAMARLVDYVSHCLAVPDDWAEPEAAGAGPDTGPAAGGDDPAPAAPREAGPARAGESAVRGAPDGPAGPGDPR
jgi:hypothetical protein